MPCPQPRCHYFAHLAAALDLTDATLESDSLSLYVDASLAATSSETCEIGAAGSGPPPTGLAQARLPLDAADDADLGVGLTEALMGEGLHAAWEAGWFCVEADSVRALLDGLQFAAARAALKDSPGRLALPAIALVIGSTWFLIIRFLFTLVVHFFSLSRVFFDPSLLLLLFCRLSRWRNNKRHDLI